jgi:archaellum component FlaC
VLSPFSRFGDNGLRRFYSPLNSLLECGLFEPEQGEGQKWGQRESKYTATIGTHLLAKIHVLDNKLGRVDRQQNHPVDRLDERIDFIGDAADRVGKVVDELNGRVDCQDVQIPQLADMVNDLVGKVEGQAKEIHRLKESREEQCKVINQMTAKLIAVEQYTKDIQKKVFPKVRRSRAT